MIEVVSIGTRLALRGDTYDYREEIKQVPTARWDPSFRVWTVAARPHLVAELAATFPDALLDDGARDLLAQHRAAACLPARTTRPPVEPRPLWKHQLAAYHWCMSRPAVLLHMGMGTGKTLVVLTCALNLRATRILVLCPKSVADAWGQQLDRHCPETFRLLNLSDGTTSRRAKLLGLALADKRSLLAVVNYDAAWRSELAKQLLGQRWDLLILDESHRIKAWMGRASKYCATLRNSADRAVALTGTPTPHSPEDLPGQCRALDPTVLGTSIVAFRARYAVMGGYEMHEVIRWRNLDDLQRRLAPLVYHCTRDVLVLPEATTVDRYCDLEPEARRVYHDLEEELLAEIGDREIVARNSLVKLLRLQQITSGVLDVEGVRSHVSRAKQDLLVEVLEDIGDEPVVVFCRFVADLDAVHAAAEAAGCNGSREISGRRHEAFDWQGTLEESEEDFQQRCRNYGHTLDNNPDFARRTYRAPEGQVLAVQIQAGGLGIDLTRARYAIMYSVTYSAGDYYQAIARIHRPGQERPVTYVRLLARKSIDAAIYRSIEAKKKLADQLAGDDISAEIIGAMREERDHDRSAARKKGRT